MQELYTVPHLQWQVAKATTLKPFIFSLQKHIFFENNVACADGWSGEYFATAAAKVKI